MGVDEPCASKGVPRRELESVGGSRRWRMNQGEESAAVEKNKYSRGSGTQIFSGTASGREERPGFPENEFSGVHGRGIPIKKKSVRGARGRAAGFVCLVSKQVA